MLLAEAIFSQDFIISQTAVSLAIEQLWAVVAYLSCLEKVASLSDFQQGHAICSTQSLQPSLLPRFNLPMTHLDCADSSLQRITIALVELLRTVSDAEVLDSGAPRRSQRLLLTL